MLGAIIGDIVGSRFEFKNLRSTNFSLFDTGCEFTDDTICTVAVAEWLLNDKTRSEQELTAIMRKWCRKYPSSYGSMFSRWIHDDSMGPYNSFGNGSAMRVSPCGWASSNLQEILSSAKASASISHNHIEGLKGAMSIAEAIYWLRAGNNKSSVLHHISEKYKYQRQRMTSDIRRNNTFDETCQVCVPQAMQCFYEGTDFESCIRLAVSIGGDSDTIAAITGSLAEAHYGIPKQLKEKALSYLPLDMKKVITEFTSQLDHGKVQHV